MSAWKKQFVFSQWYYAFGYSLPILIIFSLSTNEMLLFRLTVLMLLIFLVNYMYLIYVSKRLDITNKKITRKLFPGEYTTLIVPFENKGKLPIFHLHGIFQLHFTEESVKVLECRENTNNYSRYEHVFSIPELSKSILEIKMKALKRGTAELRTIEIDIYDFFKLFHIRLSYTGNYRGEVVVYPTPKKVNGLQKVVQLEKGEHTQPFSLYEDVMMLRGSRKY